MNRQKFGIENGLSESEVLASREKFGSNRMSKRRKKSFAMQFLGNLSDPVIRVLLISLVLNIVITFRNIDWLETGGIALAVVLATTISTLSEYSSQAAFEKLNEGERASCRVRRGGEILEIDVDEVVVGDVLILSAGEKIYADGVLISGKIFVDQSAMTGESAEVEKTCASKNEESPNLSPSSKHSCLRGCVISSGEGEVRVCAVGDNTNLGSVFSELQEQVRESPLKLRLSKLARQISALGYGAAVLIALMSIFSSLFIESDFSRQVIISKLTNPSFMIAELLHSITLGLTVVIMAVPEGLPMMIAVVLSSNIKRMLRDMVLVRKPTGIEAAGSMNLLFTDKTGTLTRGKMSVVGFILPNGREISTVQELKRTAPEIFAEFYQNALYNCTSTISGGKISGGNATERAILHAIRSYARPDYSAVEGKLPFDSKNKYSTAKIGGKTYIKGAPEVLLKDMDFDKYALECRISKLSGEGRRVLVMGVLDGEKSKPKFTCAIVLSDPIRQNAKGAVDALLGAGVDVVMVTGDSALTAKSIARQVGILRDGRELCLEHGEMEKMSDDELISVLPKLSVVARAHPSDKSRLVKLAQSRNLVVGMTGDGINDAPALRRADIGFAMGSGSDVAKEAGDIIILDNNLSSIVKAVLYGRNVFKSIRKFLVFQLTMNFSSALVCMLGPLLGFETPITVTQMLWVNMIMDTLGGLAFAGEAPSKRTMRERPKRRDEPILNPYMLHQIFISGSFSALISMLFLKNAFFVSHFRESENDLVLLSAFFALFIFLGVMQCVNSRTDRLNLFVGITKNPAFLLIMLAISVVQISFVYFGGAILRATPLSIAELKFTLECAFLAVPFELVRKIAWRFSGHTEGF